MIHYHGTPITPRSELLKLAGKHFCVSISDGRDADWCLANGQSVMWDNGAFSAHTRGVDVNWAKYYEWIESRISVVNWAIVPDVIDGTAAQQADLTQQWPYRRDESAVVWHMGLPVEYLLALADEWPRVCFGSTAQYWQVGGEAWERRCDEAWNALARRGLDRRWFHLLRGLAMCGERWPFASADSSNVARHHADSGVCPERMARRIDASQSPIRWTPKPTQKGMFDAA